MALTDRERHLLALISGAINQKKAALPADTDWPALFADAAVQAVPLLALEGAAAHKEAIDPALYNAYRQGAYKRMVKNQQVDRAQAALVALLAREKAPYVILKGRAAAAYYPDPSLRALGDVDFLVDPADTQRLSACLEQEGYTKYLENHVCHLVFRRPGAHLEMHFEPAGIPHGAAGDKARAFFQPAVHRPEDRGAFLAPAPLYHGAILLLHMQHHMVGEGLGLRHLCDWACYVAKTHTADFWTAELIPFLKSIGLFTYMNIMTAVCVSYLAIPAPQWLEPVEPALCQEVIRDVLQSGNFGRKDDKRSASAVMVSNHGKDGTGRSKTYYLYHALHSSTLQKYPLAQKSKVVAFLLDSGRAIRYMARAAVGKRYSPLALMPEAEKRRRLYREFHLFE